MLEADTLIQQVDAECPYEGAEANVWKAAVRMLARNGAVLCPTVASVRFPPLTQEKALSIIRLSVMMTRIIFEKAEGRHPVAEGIHEGSLAGKVYCL